MNEVKGFKVFNPDWTCRGFQYETGKTFEENITPVCCDRGFHFCKELKDCFNYYQFNPDNKVAKVIALGEIDEESDNSKCCTNKIQIVEEITWEEVLRMVNLGKGNAGFYNSGNRNSGNRNSGDWNLSSFNNGCFNTIEHEMLIFDKPSGMSYRNWMNSDARCLLNEIPKNVVERIYKSDMSDEEKSNNPTYECTGYYLKILDESECSQMWWDGLSESNRNIIKAIPNFDAEIFEQVTGIKVE